MTGWAARLSTLGIVHAFDYDYRIAGKSLPDKPDALKDAHRRAFVEMLHAAEAGDELILVGKSMGSRVSAWLLAEGLSEWAQPWPIRGLICFGFPLVGQRGASREAELLALYSPVFFAQGTRDAMAPLDLLEGVRARMGAPTTLHVVEGGDHSLEVGARALKAAGETQADVDGRILSAIRGWLG